MCLNSFKIHNGRRKNLQKVAVSSKEVKDIYNVPKFKNKLNLRYAIVIVVIVGCRIWNAVKKLNAKLKDGILKAALVKFGDIMCSNCTVAWILIVNYDIIPPGSSFSHDNCTQ